MMTVTVHSKSIVEVGSLLLGVRKKADSETNPFYAGLDKAHQADNFFDEPISEDVWRDKYKYKTDRNITDMCWRVAAAVNGNDGENHVIEAYNAMRAGLWMPAGRILAGAGTAKRVTLINCFVNSTISDDMESICAAQTNTTLTMQQGGGMGTDFSTIRPENAILTRTHSKASGPLPFMDGWNAWSRTIRSAGDRRGAMMGTLCDTHPDLPKFITAKREPGRLIEFNVSILVSDALMDAIAEDEDWLLHFPIPPSDRDKAIIEHDFDDEDGTRQYVYSVWKARDLWRMITENTYEWSEPGIIFIDRINQLNNLSHVEEIRCTNPCGEQPLPPHGACCLGHINLARLVQRPFTEKASFDWATLRQLAKIGQRFLDNVLDITEYPLYPQAKESIDKRRTGLGFTGLADAIMQMRYRYGSPNSVNFAEKVMETIALCSYEQNIALAKEKGPCWAMDPQRLIDHNWAKLGTFVKQRLPQTMIDEIAKVGLRNGVALAPTGTISVVYGNLDGSGCECAFAHEYDRKVRQPTESGKADEYRTYNKVRGYTHRLWKQIFGDDEAYPNYFVTAQDLSIEEHVSVQAVVQRWVDASVSKTVNCPKDMTYEEFSRVYELAYTLGCKGCTTYRPSDVRGSILSVPAEDRGSQDTLRDGNAKRPERLYGTTYQIKWPRREAALYLTINEDESGYVREILCASKDTSSFEWVTALTLMITAIFKKGGDVSFVASELKQVRSVEDATWVNNKFYGSLVAYIGEVLERHFNGNGHLNGGTTEADTSKQPMIAQAIGMQAGETCPACKAPAVIRSEGCKKCTVCGWSKC
jgi:ribonucleoside-diphosphate reductase alpha chain